jgi:hypothetical protein
MSELRTIDDLTSWICSCNCITFDNKICRSCGLPARIGEIDYEELKKEIINLIKSRGGIPMVDDDEIIREFMRFGNISEEDLQ